MYIYTSVLWNIKKRLWKNLSISNNNDNIRIYVSYLLYKRFISCLSGCKIHSMPRITASSFTAENIKAPLRPLVLSGCVTTASYTCPGTCDCLKCFYGKIRCTHKYNFHYSPFSKASFLASTSASNFCSSTLSM